MEIRENLKQSVVNNIVNLEIFFMVSFKVMNFFSQKLLGEGLVKANARLTELDLSDNAFGPIGVKGLAALLSSPSCYNLQILRLNNNGLGIGGGKLLSSALLDCYQRSKQNGNPLALRVFIAGRNRLENEGAKALSSVFSTIGTLEEIAMPQNGIYHVGVTALAESFAKNPNLRVLNLNDNTVGPKGSVSLASALRKLPKLQSLNLGDCLLKTKGAISLADALKHLDNLSELTLDSNEIKTEGGMELAKALASKRLRLIELDSNAFGEDGIEKIKKALGDNEKALMPVDNDEGSDDEEEEKEEGSDEDVEEEEEDVDEKNETLEQPIITEKINFTAEGFLDRPTGDNLVGLGVSAPQLLQELAESEGTTDDTSVDVFLNTFVPVLMKVSSLSCDAKTEVSSLALSVSETLYQRLFEWARGDNQRTAFVDNALLVELGLIKSEDKKYRPPWNVDACIAAVQKIRNKDYFPTSTGNCLELFLKKKEGARTRT